MDPQKCLYPAPVFDNFAPLQELNWGDSKEVWQVMMHKEEIYQHSPAMLDRHPQITSLDRTEMLLWLMQVCDMLYLQRETFYLATDYFDRFLLTTRSLPYCDLHLSGIAALFIAAKSQDLHHATLEDVAIIGDFSEQDILQFEILVLKGTEWKLAPVTVIGWFSLYLQMADARLDSSKRESSTLKTCFSSPQFFAEGARLLDLCVVDSNCLSYKYSVLAAAALYHITRSDLALTVSGLQWNDLLPCIQWMAPCMAVLREAGPATILYSENYHSDDAHNMQRRCVDISMVLKAQKLRSEVLIGSITVSDKALVGPVFHNLHDNGMSQRPSSTSRKD